MLGLKTKKQCAIHIVRRSLIGTEIPKWCVGDAVNSFKYDIDDKQKSKVRNWYLENTSESIEIIKETTQRATKTLW